MGYKKRIDSNQNQVVDELRQLGFSVVLTHTLGNGKPDFTVGFNGYNLLVELKSDKGKLTKDETQFFDEFTGTVVMTYNTKEIVDKFIQYVVQCHSNSSLTIEKLILLQGLR